MTFDRWMAEVDRILLEKIGLSSKCLCDVYYFSMWENDWQPIEAAQEALNAEWGTRAPNIMEME